MKGVKAGNIGVAGSIAVAILLVSTIFRLVTAQNGKSRK